MNVIEDFKLRQWIAELEGGAGGRSLEDLDAIKIKLAAMMMFVGGKIREYQKMHIDPFVEDPNVMEALKDIDALLNEIFIYEY